MLASPNIISNANYAHFTLPKLTQLQVRFQTVDRNICMHANSGLCRCSLKILCLHWWIRDECALLKDHLRSAWHKRFLNADVMVLHAIHFLWILV